MKLSRPLFGLILISSLAAVATPVLAESGASAPGAWGQDQAGWQAHRAQHVQDRLNQTAIILQLTPAQMNSPEWANFVKANQDMVAHAPWRHDDKANADAATLIRARADMARHMADKLNTLANATQALQTTLTEAQRMAFNVIVRQEAMHFMHRPMGEFGHGNKQ